jgi:hypothetical protein
LPGVKNAVTVQMLPGFVLFPPRSAAWDAAEPAPRYGGTLKGHFPSDPLHLRHCNDFSETTHENNLKIRVNSAIMSN